MRFVCESCRAQYMINDDKVGPKGVKVRCRKCGYVILVKKTDARGPSAATAPPVALSNDPDDALATQVLQNPLTGPDQTSDVTNPGAGAPPSVEVNGAAATHDEGAGKPGDSFFGADEDEIGAVFDQVLKSGPQTMKDGSAKAPLDDNRQSTRVLDAELVRKLAEESAPATDAAPAEAKKEEVPQTDWYIAIDEKQTGPLTLDKSRSTGIAARWAPTRCAGATASPTGSRCPR